jgi:hypothetical protein
MLDGVKLFIPSIDFLAFKEATGIEFLTPTNMDTGEIKPRTRKYGEVELLTREHTAKVQTYEIRVRETERKTDGKPSVTSWNLELTGSFHKNFYSGQNSEPFTWPQLQTEIKNVCDILKIEPAEIQIQNLEFGVNIPVEFRPFVFLEDHLLAYKRPNLFQNYKPDRNGKCIGYHSIKDEYSVKLYDKGLQYDLFPEGKDCGLMRFELRYTKMRYLNGRGIKTVADLMNWETIYSLKTRLLDTWNHVLFIPPGITVKDIPRLHKEFYQSATRSSFWKTADIDARRKYRVIVDKAIKAKRVSNVPLDIYKQIAEQWESLLKISEISPGGKKDDFRNFTIKIKGENSEKRVCLWCKRDISDQKPGSRFCAAKYRGGKEVNRCRDKFRRAGQKWRKAKARKQARLFVDPEDGPKFPD